MFGDLSLINYSSHLIQLPAKESFALFATMDDIFDLPVLVNDNELLFSTRLLQLGYTHKFEVDVYGTLFLFEPDEERAYRAIVDPDALTKHFDAGLLQAIAEAIEKVLGDGA